MIINLKWATIPLAMMAMMASSPVSSSPQAQERGGVTAFRSITFNPYNDFKPALETVMNKMMRSYQAEVNDPLILTVLDSNEQSTEDVIRLFSSNSVYDPSISLGLHFERKVQVNGVNASACVLQYRPEGMENLIRSYELANVFSRKEILYYIAAHEMGHCVAYHQAALGKFKALSIKEHEVLSDKFAISFFYANGQPQSAKRVATFNRVYTKSETHHHPEVLDEYVGYLDVLFRNSSPQDLIKSTRDIFYLASDQSERI